MEGLFLVAWQTFTFHDPKCLPTILAFGVNWQKLPWTSACPNNPTQPSLLLECRGTAHKIPEGFHIFLQVDITDGKSQLAVSKKSTKATIA